MTLVNYGDLVEYGVNKRLYKKSHRQEDFGDFQNHGSSREWAVKCWVVVSLSKP